MTITKDIKYERGGSTESQFQIWRLPRISDVKKFNTDSSNLNQKSPIRLHDSESFHEEIMFPSTSVPTKMRGLHLSVKQTRILTTLLPNEIIKTSDLSKDAMETFVGVLLFADVSGFTALCEKYNSFGQSGSDKLTVTLNKYVGAVVEVIYKNGGDVLKFSGDAILALWRLEKNEYISSLIHRVISCALFIQNSMGVYETDVKILLRVKLAISAGNMTFSVIGNDNSRHYLIAGAPVYEVKSAEEACKSGEVILSLSAWGHLSPVNYEYIRKDSEHVKIVRIIYSPENSKREILWTENKGTFNKIETHLRNRIFKDSLKKKITTSGSASEIRALVEESSHKELSSGLRTFLIPSVIQQIDADLPMEYLSEMRNVTIMFVNIIPNRLNTRTLINLVDKAYINICSLAHKAMGSVNKVSLFDKDVMILIIFGLRGFNHEGEVAACLRCGYDIRQACCSLDGVFTASVGCTTGQAYCGVVGHPLRREYTVIGAIVNKAARIMCAYPGKVTCDRDTFISSNLGASFFTIQKKKALKGIEDTGPIYEFTLEKSKNTLAAMQQGMYPILGREEEIKVFRNLLRSIPNTKLWEKAIVVTGQGRIGKTRLLDEMILEGHKKGFMPIAVALHNVHSTLAYGTAQSIIKEILEIPNSATISEKEERLSLVLRNQVPSSDFCYLNEVMNVKFPQTFGRKALDPVKRFEKIKMLFHTILKVGTKSVLFAIDDIDFCDELSWKLILSVIETRAKFLVMTMPRRLKPGPAAFLKFPPETDAHILRITLPGIPEKHLATLACQILNARAIPPQLEKILIERSQGNPGWCESFLLSLSQSNILTVEEMPEWHIRNLGFILPPESDLKRTPYAAISAQRHSFSTKQSHAEHLKNQGGIPEERKSSLPKWKILKHSKNMRHRKGEKNGSIDVQYKKISGINLIEEAYEDLRQRIQLVRYQSKMFNGVGEFVAKDLHREKEEAKKTGLTEESEEDQTGFSKLMEPNAEPHFLPSIALTSRSNFGSVEKIFGHFKRITPEPDDVSNRESDDSLRERISLIRRRFSSRQQSTADEYFKAPSDGETHPILKSVENVNSEKEVPNIVKSKSAEPLITHKGAKQAIIFKSSKGNTENEEPGLLPSFLWKSHTEDLIDESVRLFRTRKMNMKSEKSKRMGNVFLKSKKRKKKVKKKALLDSGSDSDPESSSVSLKSSEDSSQEAIKNVKSSELDEFESQRKTLKFESEGAGTKEKFAAKEKLVSLQEKSVPDESPKDVPETSKPQESQASRPKSRSSKKGSKVFVHRSIKKLSDKGNIYRRSWISRVFDWTKKDSDVGSLSDSSLELPTEVEGGNTMLPAILLSPNVNLDEVATPEVFVGVIMSAFDCLGPYEQLMLKCGSIIGEKFTRKMLNAIMHNPNPLLTAEAVRRLFEIQILCCGSDVAVYSYDNERRRESRCLCSLSINDYVDETLPKYSFCRVLLFKYAKFRSTLYELIPLDQKREFHIRAVLFLEKEIIFCPSCELHFKSEHGHSQQYTSFSDSEAFAPDSRRGSPSHSLLGGYSQGMFQSWFSTVDLGKKKNKFEKTPLSSLLVPVCMPDFKKCDCLILQADALRQLIDHCIAAELKEKEIEFMINYSSILITLGELDEASKILSELEVNMKSLVGNRTFKKKERHFFMGRIHLLLGQLSLETGSLKKANSYLLSALKHFGSEFNPLYLVAPFQYIKEYFKLVIAKDHRKISSASKSAKSQNYRGKCLLLLSNVLMLQDKWEVAKLVALRALNFLGKSKDNFIELCEAYSNAIDIFRHFGDFKLCRKLEASATKSFIALYTYQTALELIAAGRLNCSVFNARLISGYLQEASRLGESAVKISQCMSSNKLDSYVIPQVAQTMMMMAQLNKAARLILLLPVHDIWRYTLALEFILETGFMIESGEKCLDAISRFLNNERKIIDLDIQRRAISTIYVWMSRLGKYEEAEMWYAKLPQVQPIPLSGNTVNNMMTVLKVLEGDLLTLASLQGQGSRNNALNKKITAVIKALVKSTKTTEVMLPRFLHLRAYHLYQTSSLNKALITLDKAKKISISQGNILERLWISHSKGVWTRKIDFDENLWTASVENGKLLKWTEDRDLLNWKRHMYTLK